MRLTLWGYCLTTYTYSISQSHTKYDTRTHPALGRPGEDDYHAWLHHHMDLAVMASHTTKLHGRWRFFFFFSFDHDYFLILAVRFWGNGDMGTGTDAGKKDKDMGKGLLLGTMTYHLGTYGRHRQTAIVCK